MLSCGRWSCWKSRSNGGLVWSCLFRKWNRGKRHGKGRADWVADRRPGPPTHTQYTCRWVPSTRSYPFPLSKRGKKNPGPKCSCPFTHGHGPTSDLRNLFGRSSVIVSYCSIVQLFLSSAYADRRLESAKKEKKKGSNLVLSSVLSDLRSLTKQNF